MTGAYPVLPWDSLGPTGPVRSTRTPRARTFRGTPASVREARSFVGELLAGCPARDTLMTCVSEFCANAIAHTASGNGGVFTVEVDCPRDGVARVAVTDDGGASVPAPGALDLMAEGGRGLAMVAACTNRWGFTDARPGRTVWAESCWPVGVPSPRGAARQPSRYRRFRAPIGPARWRDPAVPAPRSPDDDRGGGAALRGLTRPPGSSSSLVS